MATSPATPAKPSEAPQVSTRSEEPATASPLEQAPEAAEEPPAQTIEPATETLPELSIDEELDFGDLELDLDEP